MSSQAERDPAEGITGIDTFKLWYTGYRTGILETVEGKYFPLPMIPAEDEFAFDGHPEDLDPHATIFLRSCPWVDVPPSLQEVLKYQYPSAEADVQRVIDVKIKRRQIIFDLSSPLVVEGVDTLGEFEVLGGLVLQTQADNESPYSGYEVGKWKIRKRPVEAPYTDENRFDKAFGSVINHPAELIPSTTNELQDLVRFLEKSKGKAEVREIQLFITE